MNAFKELLLEQLSKNGLSFLLLGFAVFYLYTKQEKSDFEWKEELRIVKKDYAQCNENYQNILFDQLSKTTSIIDKNTKVLEDLTKSHEVVKR